MTDTDTYTIVPFSEWDGGLLGFMGQLRYPDGPGQRQRFEGDHHLLGILNERLRVRHWESKVADIPEGVLRTVVEDVETRRFGSWELGGTDSQSILERLDEHFAPLQEAHIAYCGERDELLDRVGRESARLSQSLAATEDQAVRAIWGLPAA